MPIFNAKHDVERRALASSVVYYSMKSLLVVEKGVCGWKRPAFEQILCESSSPVQ